MKENPLWPYHLVPHLRGAGADAGFVKRGGRVSKFVKRGSRMVDIAQKRAELFA